ncbi:type IV secretion protein Rhs [Duganella sp. BJB488]|nr:type IV secretion protein Rhs [Duganella sp. BJB489]RFP20018.1 type IV secretion protein Rhs [Duganella sp. BJB488]RFP38407.1 type IV secretion protein Rhs [Duganella sp. BJB480]
MCPAAARLNDPIAHTSTMGMLAKMGGSLLVGALVGAALTALVAAAVVATVATGGLGFAAVLAIGFGVSVAMEATGLNGFIDNQINRAVDKFIPPSIEGKITSGAPNVTFNSLPAARAASPGDLDVIHCGKHSSGAPPMLAQGSDNVFINSQPATRIGDMTTCGGTIAEGSADVFVGGGTLTVRDIKDERPWWITALGVAIGVALALCGRGKLNISSLKAALPCLLMNMGASMLGTYVGSKIRTFIGNPVNVITGGKVLRESADILLPGPIQLGWSRFYSSHDTRDGGLLGRGWSVPFEVSLTLERTHDGELCAVTYCDAQGRQIRFPAVMPGESHLSTAEGCYLICTELGHYLVESVDGIYRDFGIPDAGFSGTLALQRIEDRNGNWQALDYAENGRLVALRDGCGHRLELRYDGGDPRRVSAIVLTDRADGVAHEVLVQYRYTSEYQLAEVIDRTGTPVRNFAYANALMIEHNVPGGLRCCYSWEGRGAEARVVRHWTNDGEQYTFDYDIARGRTQVRDQIDRLYQWEWNDDCQPTAYTDAEGHTWRYTWDRNRQLVEFSDPAGNRTRFEYDELGREIAVINALDQIERTQWHERFDVPRAEWDAAGNRWSYEYDQRGNLILTTDPEGYQTEQVYDERGLPHTICDARGGYKHLEWNRCAQLSAYTDCSGKRTSFTYDARGHLINVTNALGGVSRYEVDVLGRVTATIAPDGSTQRFRYDSLGRISARIDAAGRVTEYHCNGRGLLQRRIDAMGRGVCFKYDAAFRLAELVNENGESYRFAYDRNDNRIEERGLDGSIKRVDHDVCGNAHAITDAAGEADAITMRLERDALGRVVVKHARGRGISFRYGKTGRVVQAQSFTDNGLRRVIHEDVSFTYGKRGELTGETGHLGTLTHEYDELGNRCATILPDGRTIGRLHYGSGHLHQLNIDGEVISDIERDDLYREVVRTQGALSTRYSYDAMGRKRWEQFGDAAGLKPALRKEWTYDLAGELTTKRHSRQGSSTFAYDPLGRITSATHEAQRELFRWDAAANMVDSNQGGGYVKYNRVQVLEDKRFEYDVHGRLESKRIGRHTVQRFSYDGEHRLVQVETNRDGVRQAVHFDYDPLGRRIRKHDDFGTTHFLWDGVQLLQEQRGKDVATYVYEPDSFAPLARFDSVLVSECRNAAANDPATEMQPDILQRAVYYFHNDVSGLPEEMSTALGDIVWEAKYRTWGNAVTETWAPSASGGGCPLPQNLRFQGQYLDREIGLHYNTFRFYDPDLGTYISGDPIGILGGNNLHQFAANPIRWADPLGWYNGEGVRGLGKYHTFHEHVLSVNEYKLSDDYHFSKANESVYQRLQTDPEFRRTLQTKYPGVIEHVQPSSTGNFSGDSPPGMTWHHADKPGSLVLADRLDHRKFAKIYHPDGTGGRNKWGGGTGCR